ncbi:MAG: hypothetical protein FJY88_09780 [Candidatus Eisenbacteria bacterium]|nr:hypothetical protein [Candidatus Eisenbacteria bacterium]
MDAFDSCIRNGRLKPAEATEEALSKEIRTALEELAKARSCYRDSRLEETVVQSYFAMYRSCKSLLLSGGYKDSNLYSLVAGITKLYVTPGALDPELVDLLKIAKDQKDLVHEGARCGRKDTGVILAAAERLLTRACELLALPGIAPPEAVSEGEAP